MKKPTIIDGVIKIYGRRLQGTNASEISIIPNSREKEMDLRLSEITAPLKDIFLKDLTNSYGTHKYLVFKKPDENGASIFYAIRHFDGFSLHEFQQMVLDAKKTALNQRPVDDGPLSQVEHLCPSARAAFAGHQALKEQRSPLG